MNATKISAPAILAVGGAHIDRRGRLSGSYGAGTSNPGVMREEVGGGAFNALRNACRLGGRGTMLSARGGDLAGRMVESAIAEAGITDLSATHLDRTTPSYTAILDRGGDLICGFADMALYEVAFEKQLRRQPFHHAVTYSQGVLTDANPPQAALERLAGSIRDLPLFAIATSPAKVERLSTILPTLAVLFMNQREARALAGVAIDVPKEALAEALSIQGLRRAVITAGAGPALLAENGKIATLAPPPATDVRDVTGAGDSLAGVTILRMLQGMEFQEAVRHGFAAALLTIENENAVADFDERSLHRRLTDVPEVTGA